MKSTEIAKKYNIDKDKFENYLIKNDLQYVGGLNDLSIKEENVDAYVQNFLGSQKSSNPIPDSSTIETPGISKALNGFAYARCFYCSWYFIIFNTLPKHRIYSSRNNMWS